MHSASSNPAPSLPPSNPSFTSSPFHSFNGSYLFTVHCSVSTRDLNHIGPKNPPNSAPTVLNQKHMSVFLFRAKVPF